MRYAIIENDIVINVVVSDEPLGDNWVHSDVATIGDSYENGGFVRPADDINPSQDTRITKPAFKQRLTQAERIAIRAAAQTDPIVYDFLDIMDSATFIDLSRQDTIDGLTAMETTGLLNEGRANEILTTPVEEHERFTQ